MIHFDQVAFSRGGKTIISDATFDVAQGEKAVLIGPSGCGKTSLMMTIPGLVPLDEGRITVDGVRLAADSICEIRSKIAHIGQEPELAAETMGEALMLPFTFRANRGLKPDDDRVDQLLDRLQLSRDILEKRCAVVSGGEKQRLVIARALLMEKTIFLTDEVTSALDKENHQKVVDLLLGDPSLTILSVSHNPKWIERCGKTLEIKDQRVQVRGV